jgi:hypothetical protein
MIAQKIIHQTLSAIQSEDLWRRCPNPECSKGEVPNPEWAHTLADDFDWENFDFVALQKRVGCEFLACPTCHGKEEVLTELGQAFKHLSRLIQSVR